MYFAKQSLLIKATLIIMAILLIAFYCLDRSLYASPEGYCEEQKRFLTDEEFVLKAIQSTWNYPEKWRPHIDGSPSSELNFLRSHPYCCKIERRQAREAWGQKWQAIVVLTYETKEKDYSRDDPNRYVEIVEMNECGYVRN
ncbi:hypothetical protein [Methylophilus sp. 5]|uniref:hypothetical protein n=1 Tax=Methylophilus sp. 5 TaxID=1112274 RepID=UPI00048EF29D|nr:hypothetical protein [Methylophilus sp. 5]